tara:strand:- start:686 stop:1351 length:666 start_codon:yes stop_codon:yes gene_type:complete
MNNQDTLDSMDFEEFSSYSRIELETMNELNNLDNIVNDINLPDYVFVPEDYVRVYVRENRPNVGMYRIKKCLEYIGTINTEQQFSSPSSPNSSPSSPNSPPSTPPNQGTSNVMVVTPESLGGKKKKSRKVKNKKKNLTRKGGSKQTKLDLRITDKNGQELFVPVIKDKNGNLTYSEDANIFATIRSDGVPPIYSPKWKDFDTIAFQNGGKSKKNKTKKKNN